MSQRYPLPARTAAVVLLATALLLSSGCEDEMDEPSSYEVSPNRPKNESCFALPPPPPSGSVRLEPAFTHVLTDGQRIQQAIELVQSPADPATWYLILQKGEVLRFSQDPNDTELHIAMDIADKLDFSKNENGLVGMTLHPDFADNGYGFFVYTVPGGAAAGYFSRVGRFEATMDGGFDPDSEHVLLDVPQWSNSHSGNHVAFGPDGYLYYCLGDDRATDVNAQDPNTLQGSVLRIDPSQPDAGANKPYSIPPDNPFAAGGGAPEVFAYGLRNPWRFSFDPVTGELLLGDVGQDRREEINLIVSGGNYGWPIREGTLCYPEGTESCEDDTIIDPLVEYDHSEGATVVAGHVYRKGDIPELADRYVFADYVNGNIWSVDRTETPPGMRLEIEGSFFIASMARAADGTLYAVRYAVGEEDGGIYELVPNTPEPSSFPERLSETGCLDPDDPRLPADGVVAYEPAAKLWSDAAGKERFLAIPNDQRIQILESGRLLMPEGSVLIKHFRFGERYHETRLLMRTETGWHGYSYEWNDEQTDAVLLPSSLTKTLPDGTRWNYPSRANCLRCHTEVAERILGLEVGQLDFALEAGGQSQLEWLVEHDYLVPEIDSKEAALGPHTALPDPFGDAPLDVRARAYLHSNCAHCHQPEGTARGSIDLRFETPFAETKLCDQEPENGGLWSIGGSEQLLLRPGQPDNSILYLRMIVEGYFRMPPLGTFAIDPEGSGLIREWIETMGPCPQ